MTRFCEYTLNIRIQEISLAFITMSRQQTTFTQTVNIYLLEARVSTYIMSPYSVLYHLLTGSTLTYLHKVYTT
jgi:hypothetical protein